MGSNRNQLDAIQLLDANGLDAGDLLNAIVVIADAKKIKQEVDKKEVEEPNQKLFRKRHSSTQISLMHIFLDMEEPNQRITIFGYMMRKQRGVLFVLKNSILSRCVSKITGYIQRTKRCIVKRKKTQFYNNRRTY